MNKSSESSSLLSIPREVRTRILRVWRTLRSSYWFLPSLMALGAIILASAAGFVDSRFDAPEWLRVHDAANVRVLLSTIGSSMITVAGTTFSIVIVALTLASSQYGPRLLMNFMRDTGNQVVLGTFVSTFLYCLLVLRRVEGGETTRYVPQFSATIALALALLSLGVLIYFFHHVSTSIQAGEVIADAAKRLDAAIRKVYPDPDASGASDPATRKHRHGWPDAFDDESMTLISQSTGYLDVVNTAALVGIAREHDLRIAVETIRGEFVITGGVLARIAPRRDLDEGVIAKINEACILASRRADAESLSLAVDRLAEIAVRALSPGINDPYTAVTCINSLGAGLALAAGRDHPDEIWRDEDDVARLLVRQPSFDELTDRAWGRIRHYGRGDLGVLLRLLDSIAMVATCTDHDDIREALSRHTTLIRDTGEASLEHVLERTRLIDRADEIDITNT